MPHAKQERGQWSSSLGFIVACVGSAVGLGNIWKFPYITYENGGGAFVLIYLLAVVLVGFPIAIAEMMLGRHAKMNSFGTMKKLSANKWYGKAIGALFIICCFTILSYYSVVAGWTVEYFFHSVTGGLQSLTAETVGPRFGAFVGNGWLQTLYHTIFMGLTAFIVIKGTARIEKAVKILLPILAFLVLLIACISSYKYGIGKSLSFLFNFDLSKLTGHSILEAVGHAFFTLSLGMGVMIVYGSYLPKKISLVKAGFWIAILDTAIALFACLMMYPIIFGTNMDISESAAMLFTSLTVQFNALPGGSFISALFYLLVAFAALSSTISLLEPVVAYLHETFKIPRKKATLASAGLIWFIGMGSALGNGAVQWITELKIMDRLDYFSSNWGLPVGGLCISLFCGFLVKNKTKQEELPEEFRGKFFAVWNFAIRYVSPVLVLIVILNKIGILG